MILYLKVVMMKSFFNFLSWGGDEEFDDKDAEEWRLEK